MAKYISQRDAMDEGNNQLQRAFATWCVVPLEDNNVQEKTPHLHLVAFVLYCSLARSSLRCRVQNLANQKASCGG